MTDNNLKRVGGAGGGSSDDEARTPVTAPDSIKSKALLSVLDLLGEGQIKGLVNGAESVFLDGTSLQNADGTTNYNGFTYEFRDGRQDQTVIDGFPDISTPFNIGLKIVYATPYVLTVNDIDADAVRIVMMLPALSSTDEASGDVSGTLVSYSFSMSVDNGPFLPVKVAGTEDFAVSINDKSRSKYQREHLISLPKPGSSYKIQITRITPDSTSSYLLNDTYIDSYYEIINSRLSYPNSVMFGFNIDAEQFTNIPSRSYLVDGLYVNIPSNYNPDDRTYTGIWDGSFKIGYTNNPAWILRDLLINKRYGLGEFIKESNINVGKLYSIARYCDGLVDDGQGGTEPRFTLNTVITAQREAYKVIQDICSVFRGMSYWSGGMVQVTQDSPADPEFLFNNSNVVDGLFNRVGSARKDRHSVVQVQWNDPTDLYKQKIEYVEDKQLIDTLGYRKTDTIAFGCTSRAQAHRIGLWILYTESVETNVTTFDVGLSGLQCVPGDIVKIHDQYKAGKRDGGRIKAVTRLGCTLDAPTDIAQGSVIAIQMPDGTFVEKNVVQAGTGLTDITFTAPFEANVKLPLVNSVWILTELSLVPQLARCVGVSQTDTPGRFTISVVDHNPSKYASIEQGLNLEHYPTTILDPTNSNPESMKIDEVTYLISSGQIGTKLDVSWEGKSMGYYVQWRMNSGAGATGWTQEYVTKPAYELLNVAGQCIYDFRVVGVSLTGKLSQELVGTYTTLGTLNPPKPPTNLTAVGDFRQIILNWKNPDIIDLDYIRIYENTVDDPTTAYVYDRTPGETYTRTGIPGLMKYWYWVTAVNRRGMESAKNSTAGTSAVAGVIARTDLDESLGTIIDTIGDGIDGILDDVKEITDGIDTKYDEITDGLKERVDDAFALAQAARSGNSIEGLLRNDDNFQIKQSITELGVSIGDNINAKVTALQEAAVSDRQAVAHSLEIVQAQFEEQDAAIIEEKTARASADEASATRLNGLDSKTNATNAALVQEQTTRATADSAQTTDITSLKSTTAATNAALTVEQTTRATADSAQATRLTALDSKTDTTNANLVSEQKTRADADSAMASDITIVRASVASANAAIQNEQTVRASQDSALSTSLSALTAAVNSNGTSINAALVSEQTARANADGALSSRIETTVAQNGANATAIQNETNARANADGALGTRIDTLTSKMAGDIAAAIQSEASVRANSDGALSSRVDTAQATANNATTAVQVASSSLASMDGKLSSQWTVKVQTLQNGQTYVAGMGIGIQNTAQGISQSQILLQADRVVMVNPANGYGVAPFQLISGIVFLNTAVIQDATITNAHIQDAAITYAKIGAGQIGTAHIGDATITTAKIGQLQVDSFRIGNNAVTIPYYGQIGGSGSQTAVIGYQNTVNMVIIASVVRSAKTFGGQPIYINLYSSAGSLLARVVAGYTNGWGGNGDYNQSTATAVYNFYVGAGSYFVTIDSDSQVNASVVILGAMK
jgi:predicted phage tail protein